MRALDLSSRAGTPRRILCLGAHSDDIEIGCGGFILSLLKRHVGVHVDWIVFSAVGAREREAQRSARMFLRTATSPRVQIHQFRDGFFPSDWARLKAVFEELKAGPAPDLVFTHYRDDRHQDHRILSDLAWNTFRDHWILEYEIPKFDGDMGTPNCFVPITRQVCARKVKYLSTVFGSQRDKHWFSDETFLGLMRLRGMECRSRTGYAEAFYSRKTVLDL